MVPSREQKLGVGVRDQPWGHWEWVYSQDSGGPWQGCHLCSDLWALWGGTDTSR